MSTQKNLITLCFATVFTLGLAACGGGGGGGAPVTDMPDDPVTGMPDDPVTGMPDDPVTGMPDDPVDPEAHACDAGASQDCVDARQAELDAIENDSDATVGALNAAEMALATAQTARDDANTAAAEEMTVSGLVDDAMTATADITDESTPAEVAVGRAAIDAAQESLEGMENLSADATTTLQGLIDTLESSFSPNEMAVRTAAATAAAGTKVMAIGVEDMQSDENGVDGGLGGSTASALGAGDEGAYALSIKRDRMATTVTITVQGATEDDDVEFMQAADLGHGRTMHTRAMDADEDGNVMTEVVIVRTDIEAPKATAFATVHELNANPKTTGEMDFQSLNIVGGEGEEANLAMIATDGITTSTGAGDITVKAAVEDNDDTPEDETVAAFETDATFDGAPGTLKCAGDAGTAGCTVTLDADGEITAIGDDWEFTPADGAKVDVPDADYLHYGFWLKRTTDADGATTYNEVETFAVSNVLASVGIDLNTVLGSAAYKGGSVGVYVKNVYNPDSTIASATSGHFTADATLTAYFGGPDVTDNQENTVTGTISNFALQHGEENAWSVALKGAREEGFNTFTGMANGGGAEGSFNGTFHGSVAEFDHDMNDDTAMVRPTPSSVVGEFNANFGNGTAAGGFGARKQ